MGDSIGGLPLIARQHNKDLLSTSLDRSDFEKEHKKSQENVKVYFFNFYTKNIFSEKSFARKSRTRCNHWTYNSVMCIMSFAVQYEQCTN